MQADGRTQASNGARETAPADSGKRAIEWSFHSMPVLQAVRKQLIKAQPLAGICVGACLPLTAETANLLIALRNAGAEVAACSSDASATQEEVAASLTNDHSVKVFASANETPDQLSEHRRAVLGTKPSLIIETRTDLSTLLTASLPDLPKEFAGVVVTSEFAAARLGACARDGSLGFPVLAVHDARTRTLLEQRHGGSQAVLDTIVRTAGILLAGNQVVIVGYGDCGRGAAMRARGLGAAVAIAEFDPSRGLEAALEGFRVMTLNEAAAIGDVFITASGIRNILCRDHFSRMKTNALICNAGHAANEIDLEGLRRVATSHREMREGIEEFNLGDGRKVYLLDGGRPVQARGASVLDIGMSTIALAAEYLVKHRSHLENRVYPVPDALDRTIARLKLESMNVQIDRLSLEQERYLAENSTQPLAPLGIKTIPKAVKT